MKRLNFNIKDRKTLTLGLCLILVCVFTLTIAYSALTAVLTINGNARVSAANWDIYLNNPRVTNGSATTNPPEIKTSSTLEFETTLNMPGDFYEFVVDVVNAGDIDAMIENVVKTPDLTEEQARFLKYEVSYQNGEAITTKQLLAKDTTMPIKVRIEYRKDLNNTDLPTNQIVLDLTLTLEYIQSDGTGSSVKDNGANVPLVNVISGTGTKKGNEVCIKDECFYVISSDADTVTMLSKYNLRVGKCIGEEWAEYELENPTGIQDEAAAGYGWDGVESKYKFPFIGTTDFSSNDKKGTKYSDYNGSILEEYVNNYRSHLITLGVTPVEARLITIDELYNLGCKNTTSICRDTAPKWLYSTTYWSQSAIDDYYIWEVNTDGELVKLFFSIDHHAGVRPVIVISKDYFN